MPSFIGYAQHDVALRLVIERAYRARSDALHDAAYAGDLAHVRALLADGADPNQASDSDRFVSAAERATPLHAALSAWRFSAEHLEVVRELIAAGARVDATHVADFDAERTGGDRDAEVLALLRAAQNR